MCIHRIYRSVSLLLLVLINILPFGMSSVVYAADEIQHFNIEKQPLPKALLEFSRQSNIDVMAPSKIVSGKRSTLVVGEMSSRDAINQLIKGTGLQLRFIDEQTVAIALTKKESKEVGKSKPASKKILVAQAETSAQKSRTTNKSSGSEETVDERKGMLEEIIVTATRRESSIQDTPLSITAIGADDITKRNIVGMDDYLRTVPSVSYIDRGVGQNTVVMRGVTADPQMEGFNVGTTTGIYFGETSIAGYALGSTSDIKLVDMERVEVLRGPQGTLFGSGALGGAVRNIPKLPDVENLSVNLRVGYSNTARKGGDNSLVEGMLNVPIIEGKLGFRGVAYYHENDGYYENIAGGHPSTLAAAAMFGAPELAQNQDNIGASEYTGFRGSLIYIPIEELSIKFSYLNQDLEQLGDAQADLDFEAATQARFQNPSFLGGGSEGFSNKIELFNLEAEYKLEWGTIKSISSWIDETLSRTLDISGFLAGLTGGAPINQSFDNTADVFAQEVRFVSEFDGPLNIIAGVYYEDVSSQFVENDYFGGDQSLNVLDPSSSLLAFFDDTFNIEQKAIYGELTYEIFNNLKLRGGVRVFEYEREDIRDRPIATLFTGPVSNTIQNTKSSGESFKVGLDYSPIETALLYASWSEGFRLGRNVGQLPSVCDGDTDGIIDGTMVPITNDSTDPDSLDTYELGGKFSISDGRILINGTLFRTDWEGLPINVVGSCLLATTVNGGAARLQGFELDSRIQLTDRLHVEIGGSYVDAELTEDVPGAFGASGDRLPGSPKVNISVATEFQFSLFGHDGYLRPDYTYVSGFYNNLKQSGTKLGDYHEVSIKAGVTFDRTRISIYANNITNSNKLTWLDTSASLGFGGARVQRPRTVGVNIDYSF